MDIKVFISSPYTLGNKLHNVLRQVEVAHELMNHGLVPFAPLYAHYQWEKYPRSMEECLAWGYTWMEGCDCVLRLDGKSTGADMEVELANKLGIKVFYNIEDLFKYYGKK